jgi:hypothetical protein
MCPGNFCFTWSFAMCTARIHLSLALLPGEQKKFFYTWSFSMSKGNILLYFVLCTLAGKILLYLVLAWTFVLHSGIILLHLVFSMCREIFCSTWSFGMCTWETLINLVLFRVYCEGKILYYLVLWHRYRKNYSPAWSFAMCTGETLLILVLFHVYCKGTFRSTEPLPLVKENFFSP